MILPTGIRVQANAREKAKNLSRSRQPESRPKTLNKLGYCFDFQEAVGYNRKKCTFKHKCDECNAMEQRRCRCPDLWVNYWYMVFHVSRNTVFLVNRVKNQNEPKRRQGVGRLGSFLFSTRPSAMGGTAFNLDHALKSLKCSERSERSTDKV